MLPLVQTVACKELFTRNELKHHFATGAFPGRRLSNRL